MKTALSLPKRADPGKRVLKLAQAIGPDGTSDDETVYRHDSTGVLREVRRVKSSAWRALIVRRVASKLDDIYEWTLSPKGMGAVERRGRMPEYREYRAEDPLDWDAVHVPYLPFNLYRDEWKAAKGQAFLDSSVHPGEVPFELDGHFDQYVYCLAVLQELTYSRICIGIIMN